MKAVSPPRSARKAASCVTDAAWSCSDDPLGLQRDMNDCYSRLKALVPGLPRNRRVSKMEILQHVIDYILDLQLALESACPPQRDGGSDLDTTAAR